MATPRKATACPIRFRRWCSDTSARKAPATESHRRGFVLGERPARNCYGAQVPVVPVVTAHVLIPLWFAASFTVSVTLKLPGANRWLEVEPLPVAPSPY